MAVNSPSTPDQLAFRLRLKNEFPLYAASNLKIIGKDGILQPFKLNRAQIFLDKALANRKNISRSKGVRALVLKGRQQGVTTYVQGRFYWIVTQTKGMNAYILSHAIDTTKKIFWMAHRFHDHCHADLKQATRVASANELSFSRLESSYYVGTAGSKEVGRGGTVQLFHGSEVAFWPNADSHLAGVMQSVPSGAFKRHTEVVLESTANGQGNLFYRMWQEAAAGESEYIPVFIPWYWQAEYSEEPDRGWEVEGEELIYQKAHKLTDPQMYWRYRKRQELGSEWLLKREYPSTAEEAFSTSDEDTFIPQISIMEAREPKPDLVATGPRIGGLDAARGGDRSSFITRQGRRAYGLESHHTPHVPELLGLAVQYIKKQKLDKLVIELSSVGASIHDSLMDIGYKHIVMGVWPGGHSPKPDRYHKQWDYNWGMMQHWFMHGPVEIPNEDTLVIDLSAPQEKNPSPLGAIKVESGRDLKARGARSPDEGVALSLTFAADFGDNSLEARRARSIWGPQVEAEAEYDPLHYMTR